VNPFPSMKIGSSEKKKKSRIGLDTCKHPVG